MSRHAFWVVTSGGENMPFTEALRIQKPIVGFANCDGFPLRAVVVTLDFMAPLKSKVFVIPPESGHSDDWFSWAPKTPKKDLVLSGRARMIDGRVFSSLDDMSNYTVDYREYDRHHHNDTPFKEERLRGFSTIQIVPAKFDQRRAFLDSKFSKPKWLLDEWPWNGWAWVRDFEGQYPIEHKQKDMYMPNNTNGNYVKLKSGGRAVLFGSALREKQEIKRFVGYEEGDPWRFVLYQTSRTTASIYQVPPWADLPQCNTDPVDGVAVWYIDTIGDYCLVRFREGENVFRFLSNPDKYSHIFTSDWHYFDGWIPQGDGTLRKDFAVIDNKIVVSQ